MSLRERRTVKKSRREASRKKNKGCTSSSESGGEEEHELFHYAGDRVQLMKEVLKILKSKKIKSLAPDSIKDLDMEEINTMLLEELLGISNKRLKKIFEGQNADDQSSSSSEDGDKAEKQIDIISLDDVSDDDLCLIEDGPSEKNKKDPNNGNNFRSSVNVQSNENKTKNSKKHRIKKEKKIKEEPLTEKGKLLSVLELLELQARARAIRSQIALETDSRPKEIIPAPREEDSDEDAVIVEVLQSPKEIVISSSDSEPDNDKTKAVDETNNTNSDKINKTCMKLKKRSCDKTNKVHLDDNTKFNSGEATNMNADKTSKSNFEKVKAKKADCEKGNESLTDNTNFKTTTKNNSEPDRDAVTTSDAVTGQTVSDIPLPTNEAVSLGRVQSEERNSPKRDNKSFGDSGNKTDSEDDVIRLDVVEIEGIDD